MLVKERPGIRVAGAWNETCMFCHNTVPYLSTVLGTLKAWEDPKYCQDRLGLSKPLGSIERTRLNVNGSSLAAGHPFAATGGRIVATLAKLLAQKGSGRGLISICAAGGQGVVAILEAA